jgi:hypothetical protein
MDTNLNDILWERERKSRTAWIQAGGIGNHDSHNEFEAVGSRNNVPDGQLGDDRGLRGLNTRPGCTAIKSG